MLEFQNLESFISQEFQKSVSFSWIRRSLSKIMKFDILPVNQKYLFMVIKQKHKEAINNWFNYDSTKLNPATHSRHRNCMWFWFLLILFSAITCNNFLSFFWSENFFSCVGHFLVGKNLMDWCQDMLMTGVCAAAVFCAHFKWKLL